MMLFRDIQTHMVSYRYVALKQSMLTKINIQFYTHAMSLFYKSNNLPLALHQTHSLTSIHTETFIYAHNTVMRPK